MKFDASCNCCIAGQARPSSPVQCEFVLAHGMAIDCVRVTAAVRRKWPLNTGDSTDADI